MDIDELPGSVVGWDGTDDVVASTLSILFRLEFRLARPGFLGDFGLSAIDIETPASLAAPSDSSLTGVSGLRWLACALRVKSTAVLWKEINRLD